MSRRWWMAGCALATGLCQPGVAHDFWLQPDRYWLSAGVVTPMTLQVGHGPSRQRSQIASRRITRFSVITPGGATEDLRGGLSLGEEAADGSFQLQEVGAHVLVLETDDRAQSHQPAERFDEYLRAEGLTLALELREATHRMDRDGSESFSRNAKAIVQVGSAGAETRAGADEVAGA